MAAAAVGLSSVAPIHPIAGPPSPTLTNPDLVLPNDSNLSDVSSPSRTSPPPSPTYLLERRDQYAKYIEESQKPRTRAKFQYLVARGRADMGNHRASHEGMALASSPVLGHTDEEYGMNLRPTLLRNASSVSSINTAALDAIESIQGDEESEAETLDDDESGNVTPTAPTFSHQLDQPKQQASDHAEESYAELSRRAEVILANAKKRLNVRRLQTSE